MSEKPVPPRPRRLADWINPTGAKKVHSLIDKVYKRKNLEMAWDRVQANRGSGGVDGQSLEAFGQQVGSELNRLQAELKEEAYQPQPVRQVQIPKAGKPGEYRTLGIPTIYDRVCQQAMLNRLEPIFELVFDEANFGYRRGRSTKDALRKVWKEIQGGREWIVDADLKDFFDHLDHGWMMKFVQHRVADPRILRLIQKWLKAGVMEGGEWLETEMGTPQGAVISPLLANVYLHYVFDLWVEVWRKKCAQGDVIVIRYADDNVLGFQHRTDADRFLEDFRERLGKFGLELHPDKTRRIEFGRYAEQRRKRRGEGKPETFDFLGFTHISGTNRKGYFTVKRQSSGKRMRAKLQQIKQQLRSRMHQPVAETGKWLKSVVQGYFNYHAVPGNLDRLGIFRERVTRLWRRTLLGRSQIHRLPWTRMHTLAA
ncbi:MAG: group II intron reverse transcriptase/maturase [Acidobacteriia bacterium]|nr:group II intron reverse transcriptase/maturase [Terriglobia bacterium]